MLILKPNCECCDKDLPPAANDARICTFECTFCLDCAEQHFHHICPNCKGNLIERPIRPEAMLTANPASTERFTKDHPQCTGRNGG